MNQEIKNVFTPGPVVLIGSARRISSYLVRVKVYPTERTVGSKNVVNQGVKFVQILKKLTDLRALKLAKVLRLTISSIKCCGKQYVGETTDEFRLR